MTLDAPIRYGMFIMPFHPPEKSPSQCYDEDLELIVIAEELGFSRILDRRASHDEVREHRDARDLHRPGAGRDAAASGWGRRRSACSSTIRRTSPAGWRFSITCPRAGSTSASAPAASRPTRSCTAVDPKQAAEMVDEAIETILYLWSHDPPYEVQGKYWPIKLAKSVDYETRIGFIPKPLATAASAHRRAGHEPQLAEHEDRRAARASAVRPLPDPGQRGGRHLEHLRSGRSGGRPQATPRRLEGRPLDLSGRHHQGGPRPGADQFAGAKLRVHRPTVRQGPGPADLQARPGHERRRLSASTT